MNKEFQEHTLNDEGIVKCNEIAHLYNDFLNILSQYCNESREFSIVKTKLEEACFFTKKSISGNYT